MSNKSVKLMYLMLITVGTMLFISCKSRTSNSELKNFSEDSLNVSETMSLEKTPLPNAFEGNSMLIKNKSWQKFVEEFKSTNAFPISVNEESFDSSKVISSELVNKFINPKYDYGISYFGSRFIVNESVLGLIVHFSSGAYTHESLMQQGTKYMGSNIIFFNSDGMKIGNIPSAYYKDEGIYRSEDFKDEESNYQSTLNEDGTITQLKSVKIGNLDPDKGIGGWKSDAVEILKMVPYHWDDSNNLLTGKEEIVGHITDVVNPIARKETLDVLADIKDIRFISVIMQNNVYYHIDQNCVAASKYDIIDTPEELKNSSYSYYNEWYLPIWLDQNNDHGAYVIINPTFNKSTGEFRFDIKSLDIFRKDYPIVDLDQEGRELIFVRSDEKYWMLKSEPGDYKSLMDEKFALTLPISDYSCDQ